MLKHTVSPTCFCLPNYTRETEYLRKFSAVQVAQNSGGPRVPTSQKPPCIEDLLAV